MPLSFHYLPSPLKVPLPRTFLQYITFGLFISIHTSMQMKFSKNPFQPSNLHKLPHCCPCFPPCLHCLVTPYSFMCCLYCTHHYLRSFICKSVYLFNTCQNINPPSLSHTHRCKLESVCLLHLGMPKTVTYFEQDSISYLNTQFL